MDVALVKVEEQIPLLPDDIFERPAPLSIQEDDDVIFVKERIPPTIIIDGIHTNVNILARYNSELHRRRKRQKSKQLREVLRRTYLLVSLSTLVLHVPEFVTRFMSS